MSHDRRIQVVATIPNFGSLYLTTAKLDPRGNCKGFGKLERKLMNEIIKSLSNLFEVYCLWQCMSKRVFQMLLFIPKGRLSDAEALLRSIAFYEGKRRKNTFSAEDLSDLSCYMHYVLRIFSMKWGKMNGFPPRCGKVWSNKHFKSKILDAGIIGRIFTKGDTKEIIQKLKELKVNIPLKTYTGAVYLGANTCGSHDFVHNYAWDGRRRGCVRIDMPHLTSWANHYDNTYGEYDKPSWYVEDMDMLWENLTTSPSYRGAREIQFLSIPLLFGLYMADGCYRWWKRRMIKTKKETPQA